MGMCGNPFRFFLFFFVVPFINDLMFHENCTKVNLYKARQYFRKLPIAKSQLKDAKEVLK